MLIDIRSERYKRRLIQNKKQKNKDRISEIVDLKWYEEKKKKKDDRKINVVKKVSDWDAKFEMNEWFCDQKTRDWLRMSWKWDEMMCR